MNLSPMRRVALACALLAAPLSAQAASSPSAPPPLPLLPAKVVAYASGTAFSVLGPDEKLRRIKLVGVDAPERRQRFAPEARRLAAEWLGGKPVEIAVHGTDGEGRVFGRVVVDGRDVALALIDAGLAWCDPADDRLLADSLRSEYAGACAKARSQRMGLWQDAHPVPPWEYRRLPEFDGPAFPKGSDRTCRDAGAYTAQCDDDNRYRLAGSAIRAPDGTVYGKRGNSPGGSDGGRHIPRGISPDGSDGSLCRQRGPQFACY